MKDSNDVLTKNIDQDHLEYLTQLANDQNEQAKKFNQGIVEGVNAEYVWAQVYLAVSSGPSGGHIVGWIIYKDGRTLYFKGEETGSSGYPFAMVAPPVDYQVLSYEKLVDSSSTYSVNGWGPGGTAQMNVNGRNVFITALPIGGGGFWYWSAKGNVSFMKN